jgi:dTDP-4-dehydrorhamnose 3,5-epimerase-like enzyme
MSRNARLIDLPKVPDRRGNLTFIEGQKHVPFAVERTYWTYDVPGGEERGSHAKRTVAEFFVALSGAFDVVVDDGRSKERFVLNRSYFGLFVPEMTWRSVENFSTNAVCMVLCSGPYAEGDYIRDYREFLAVVDEGTVA